MDKIVIMSGPSGAGKSTITRYVSNLLDIPLMISATTRKPREGEQDKKDYFFLTKEEFEKKISENDLMEYENIHGNYYGTLKSEVDKFLNYKNIVILEIDAKGTMQIYEKYKNQYEFILVFCKTQSLDVLKDRITKRAFISEEELTKRLNRAKIELEYEKKYNYTIVNNDFDKACEEFKEIILKNL